MIFNRDEYEYEEMGNFQIESDSIECIKFIDCKFENCSTSMNTKKWVIFKLNLIL